MTTDPTDTAREAYAKGDQARAKAADKVSDLVAGAVEVNLPPDPDRPQAKTFDAPTNAEAIDAHLDDLVNRPPGVPTGFDTLDKKIKGLRPGLIVLSAPPGAGKTTLVWQIADQVAAKGTPVLFFSYEMSRGELMNKTLARITGKDNGDIMEGKVARADLTLGIEYIKQHGQLIRVVEGDALLGVDVIRQMVEGETEKTGKAPVVIVDYLQVIPNMDKTMDRRGNVDLIVSELRRLTRDLAAPVITVSSIARASYATGGTSLAAFKESGGIEYGADIAITLQVVKEEAVNNSLSTQAVKAGLLADLNQRRIKANIVKNRRGGQWSVPFIYNMGNDEFIPDGEPDRLSYMDTIIAKDSDKS